MDLGEPIATGRTAEIFPWNGGQILKLYRREWPSSAVEHEARVARAVRDAGLPAPPVGDLVQIAGRAGLIFDRCGGRDLTSSMSRRPWRMRHGARLLARLHVQIHDAAVPALPSQREWLARRIGEATMLPLAVRQAALDALAAQPAGDRACHGDFHPGNVLLTRDAALVIDWPLVTSGNPVADVAQTSLLLTSAAPLSGRSAFLLRAPPLERARRWFCDLYLAAYTSTRTVCPRSLAEWTPLVAAARLADRVPGEIEPLHRIVLDSFPAAA